VLDVQRRLLAQGYTQLGAADGFFGDQTREAVRAFQQAGGLPVSGEVDCATWAALLGG
jgi:peptidoglycan hydrolase-like protein with peptidoglycan-binding domain